MAAVTKVRVLVAACDGATHNARQSEHEHACARLEGGCALGQMSEKKTIAEQRCVKETADTR